MTASYQLAIASGSLKQIRRSGNAASHGHKLQLAIKNNAEEPTVENHYMSQLSLLLAPHYLLLLLLSLTSQLATDLLYHVQLVTYYVLPCSYFKLQLVDTTTGVLHCPASQLCNQYTLTLPAMACAVTAVANIKTCQLLTTVVIQ